MGGKGGGTATCEAQSACMGVSVACTAETCPTGAVCCGKLGGTTMGTGSTACVSGGCGSGEDQLCSGTVPCPTGERCEMLGNLGICRPDMTPPMDGGGKMPPDASPGLDAASNAD
jgi:hypothetical protein